MQRNRSHMLLGQLVLVVIVLILPVCATGRTLVFNIRYWSAPDHTRVVIDTSDEPRYVVAKDDQKVDIEFAEASLPPDFPLESLCTSRGSKALRLRPLPKAASRLNSGLPRPLM